MPQRSQSVASIRLEIVDKSGPVAAKRMYDWDYTIPPEAVRNICMKSASTVDSHSTWLTFSLKAADAEELIGDLHHEMAIISEYLQRTRDCEQATREINFIEVKSPSSESPSWWHPPAGSGRATENML